MDDSLTEVLKEDSENNGDTLMIQCYHGRRDIILGLWQKKSSASGEDWIEDTVQVHFDKGQEETQTWRFFPTTMGDWAASPNAEQMADRLAQSKSFVFGYTNDSRRSTIDVFDVTGRSRRPNRQSHISRRWFAHVSEISGDSHGSSGAARSAHLGRRFTRSS